MDSTGSGPSASNQPQNEGAPSAPKQPQQEGALKRHADIHNDASAEKKKKKSAEELASSTRGRNVGLKKEMQKLKKEQKKKMMQTEEQCKKDEQLLITRDRLVAKLEEFGEREMCMSDKAEEKALKREETLRNALRSCENALRNKGEATFNEDDQKVMRALSIRIPEWPCLDSHIQDFAYERLYVPHHQEKGVSLRKEDLIDIITKVKSRDPTIGLPSAKDTEALERLLVAINWKVVDAVHERRFEELTKNLEQYPGVDPELKVEPVLKVKQEIDGRDELKEAVGRVMIACEDAAGSETGIELIELDDDDDDDKEGDEDELEDEEEEDDEDDEDLNFVRLLEKRNDDKNDKKDDDAMHGGPEMDQTENEGQEKQNEDNTEKPTEDRSDSRYEKETMAMEGGTSTNSPTLDRDEMMKELEGIEDIKEGILIEQMNSDVPDEEEEEEEGVENAPDGRNVNLAADTIVLDDDEEVDVGEDKKPAEVKVEVDEVDVIGPPVLEKMTPTDAWRAKVKEIQQWVNKLIPGEVRSQMENQEEEEDEEVQLVEPVETNGEDDDDDIVCDLDDFEMDSVSHSGLQLRRQKMVEAGMDVPPVAVAPREVKEEVEVIELD